MHATIITAALAAALLTTPAFAETRTIELPEFTSVDISSGIDAKVTIGPQSVTADARNAADLDELKLVVEDGVLKAYTEWTLFGIFDLGIHRELRLTISAPSLNGVFASAGSDVEAKGITGDSLMFTSNAGSDLTLTGIAAKTVTLEAAAGADLKAEGTCEVATIKADAGSDLKAADLKCADVTVSGAAGSDIEVFASNSVRADAIAGTEITVSGNPGTVTQNASAGGEIKIAD
ncbi:MAG: DUF2807 domain-containing protein [Alphaproteobacteria bacterium]|nr:MAG: DUF2807 domain-containing protein [Alphaproteobacteria bacterium]